MSLWQFSFDSLAWGGEKQMENLGVQVIKERHLSLLKQDGGEEDMAAKVDLEATIT